MTDQGPLSGVRVIEFASIGPGPFCGMMLADMGATVTRVERVGAVAPASDPPPEPLLRGRSASIGIDLKQPRGVAIALDLVERADVLVEGFRAGVMERLGLGPEVCLRRNPRLVYGRVTGWGQDGPRSRQAGHDIDYLAAAGVLHPIGEAGRPPPPPLNLVADFGGGGMLLAVGIAAALFERSRTGAGTVIDAAMAEGASLLAALIHGLRAAGGWTDDRSANLLDGSAPFYRAYETADGRFVAVGAIEPDFYSALLAGLGLDPATVGGQYDTAAWSATAETLAASFRTRTMDEWEQVFAGTDACVVGVRTLGEAPFEHHMAERRAFVDVGGVVQPAPAPRFASRSHRPAPPRPPGADTTRVLGELGYETDAIGELRSSGVVA